MRCSCSCSADVQSTRIRRSCSSNSRSTLRCCERMQVGLQGFFAPLRHSPARTRADCAPIVVLPLNSATPCANDAIRSAPCDIAAGQTFGPRFCFAMIRCMHQGCTTTLVARIQDGFHHYFLALSFASNRNGIQSFAFADRRIASRLVLAGFCAAKPLVDYALTKPER